jgi:acetyl-CoA synthetase
VPDLPKTRSGKIMRRILRQLALGNFKELGDISTLANPEIIDVIIHKIQEKNELFMHNKL